MAHHRHLAHQPHREEPERADAHEGLPHDAQARGERGAHLAAERLVERADRGDRGVRDLHARGELLCERGGERVREAVLEDRGADGDPPRLGEGAGEGEEGERGRGARDGEWGEEREYRR